MGGTTTKIHGMQDRVLKPDETVIVRDTQTGRPVAKSVRDVPQGYLNKAKQGLEHEPPADDAIAGDKKSGPDGDIL